MAFKIYRSGGTAKENFEKQNREREINGWSVKEVGMGWKFSGKTA